MVLVPSRWNQTLCLVPSPSIEKRGNTPLGSRRELLHLPEVAKKAIISCLILYRNDFQHWFTSQGCLVFSTAKLSNQSQPSLTAARCTDCCDRSNFQRLNHAILNQKP